MSFSFEFFAEIPEDAKALTLEQVAPDCVKMFVLQAIDALPKRPVPIHVKAFGHLSAGGDYPVSTATITVEGVAFQRPKTAAKG